MIASSTRDDGTLYTISPTFDRRVLFINRKLFQNSGVPEPISPMTFEQLRQSAIKLKEKNIGSFGYNYPTGSWYYSIKSIGEEMNGLPFINNDGQLLFDQPEWRDLAQNVLDDSKNKVLRSDPFMPADSDLVRIGISLIYASQIYNYIANNFSAETLAISNLPSNPSNPTSNPYLMTSQFSIDSTSEHVEEVWELLTYLMSKEAATFINEKVLLNGFVTYPDLVKIGDFKLESFMETGNPRTKAYSFDLSGEVTTKLVTTINEQFLAYIQDKISFNVAWKNIEVVVQDINANSSNFVAVK
nr:extracellular solute-binding protein [Paenibacillus sp. GSMTC-2017]